jgi:hypothetical protein
MPAYPRQLTVTDQEASCSILRRGGTAGKVTIRSNFAPERGYATDLVLVMGLRVTKEPE